VDVIVNAVIAAIALAALVVSIVVAVKQARIAREQTAIQAKVAAIEEARRAEEVAAKAQARVTASILHDKRSRLVLHNEGSAVARGVEADIVSLGGARVPMFYGIEALPVDLQPGQSMEFPFSMDLGTARRVQVTVGWTDDIGSHEEPYTLRPG
jgi:hypothetical protein